MTTVAIHCPGRWTVILECAAPAHEVAINLRQAGAKVTTTRGMVRAEVRP